MVFKIITSNKIKCVKTTDGKNDQADVNIINTNWTIIASITIIIDLAPSVFTKLSVG